MTSNVSYYQLEKFLHIGTLLYIVCPVIIFCFGWFHPVFSVIMILLIIFSVILYATSFTKTTIPSFDNVSLVWLALGTGMVLLVVGLSGSGGWGWQGGDWGKHLSLLRDLISHEWPVVYDQPEGKSLLIYYIAYYLPSAVIGKLFGWEFANHSLFLTTAIGAWLVFLWIVLLTRAHPVLCAIIFLSFSGMDVIGAIFIGKSDFTNIEWWAMLGLYSSNVLLLFDVPNQALAGWLITSVALASFKNGYLSQYWIFFLALCCFWSPFASVGLCFLLAGFVIMTISRGRCRQFFSFANWVGVFLGILCGFYFLSHFSPVPLPESVRHTSRQDWGMNFVFFPDKRIFLIFYSILIGVEFLILYMLLLLAAPKNENQKNDCYHPFVWAAFFTLLFLPWFRYGCNNDLMMRVSIPALFVTMFQTIRTLVLLQGMRTEKYISCAICYVLALGSVTPAIYLKKSISEILDRNRTIIYIPTIDSVETIFEMQEYIEWDFIGQYIGSLDSCFARYLMKSPASNQNSYHN